MYIYIWVSVSVSVSVSVRVCLYVHICRYMTLGERPFDRVPAHLVAEKASSGSLRPNIDPVKVLA